MRMKRRNEKGEVFRKSLCCVPSYDSEEEEDVLGGDSENHNTVKQGKTRGGNPENETPRRSKKESRKKQMTTVHHMKRSGTKPSSNNQTHHRSKKEHCNKEEHCSKKQQQSDSRVSIISNNRITRSLGIYNKAKRSDTILRENLKQKLCKKKFEDIKTKTARDMARVLDCSSFKIQLSSRSAGLPNVHDSPADQNSGHVDYQVQSPAVSSKSHSSCSSTGRCNNPDKQKVTPLLQSTPQRFTPQNEAVLAFKTPLQEISQILIESLTPLETFHGRNYLAEKQGQLRKMYKQSSANSHVQKTSSNVGVASEVQKRCLKRKCFEENASVMRTTDGGRKTQTVEPHSANSYFFGSELQSTSTTISGPQRVANENVTQQRRQALSATSKELNTNRGITQSNTNFEFQDKCSSEDNNRERRLGTIREHDSSCRRCLFGQECAYFPQRDEPSLPTSHNSSSFDILDFLDGVSQGSNIEKSHGHNDYMTPDPRLVSPPKKPTLDSLTPEKKFYPHKLY